MKLRPLIILSLGCWQLCAYAAGNDPGGGYPPRSNKPSLGMPWVHDKTGYHHVMAGDLGTQDKGKAKASGSQAPPERPLPQPMSPGFVPLSMDQVDKYDFLDLTLDQRSPVEDPHPDYGWYGMGKGSNAGHNPRSDEDTAQAVTFPWHVSNARQSHYNDLHPQHQQWQGYQEVQHPHQPVGIENTKDWRESQPYDYAQLWHHSSPDHHHEQHLSSFQPGHHTLHHSSMFPPSHHSVNASLEPPEGLQCSAERKEEGCSDEATFYGGMRATRDIRDTWGTFNRDVIQGSLRSVLSRAIENNISIRKAAKAHKRNRLHDAPDSWVAFAVDNPSGPIEERVFYSEPPQLAEVSQWANEERHKIAMNRSQYDLNFMNYDESTWSWKMKPEVASGQMTVTIKPDIWWDQGKEEDPVSKYQRMRANDLMQKKSRRAPGRKPTR